MGGDLGQLISLYFVFFSLHDSFGLVWLFLKVLVASGWGDVILDRFFKAEFTSFYRAELEFSFFFCYRKHLDDGGSNRVNFNLYP